MSASARIIQAPERRRRRIDESSHTRPGESQRGIRVVVGHLGEYNGHGVAYTLAEDPGIEVVAHNLGACALVEAVGQHEPRVAIINPTTEVEVREHLRPSRAQTECIVLASDPSLAYGMLLLAAGVACISLRTPPKGLISAVHRLALGERIFLAGDGHLFTDTASLTPRELEVLEPVSQGRSPDAIALLMNIRVRTVRYYTESLRSKLGVCTTRALIAAIRPG